MNCEQVMRSEVAEKYLLGRLSEAEQQAFEQHYFECPRCFDELQTYRALQTELQRVAPTIRANVYRPERAFWRWGWASLAALVILAVGVGWWVRQPRVAPVQPPQSVVHIPTPNPVPQVPIPSLAELSRVEPPDYAPVILRGAEDETTQRFRAAMRHYVKGDYAAAVPGLRAAAKLNPQATDTSFFLGICYLMTDQTDAAIEQLRRTVALGESPYLEDTHFYLAKCYLRKAAMPAAQNELERTIRLQGEHEAEARQLLQQVDRLGKESRSPQ